MVMRYLCPMAMSAYPVLTLFASLAASAPAAPPTVLAVRADMSTVTRFTGASASATVSARIIRSVARVGHDLGPPRSRMVPRTARVIAADGRPVAALIYDFE